MRKQRIVQLAFYHLLRCGIDAFSIDSLATSLGLCARTINEQFPLGDHELLMDAVEYAGKNWVNRVRAENLAITSVEARLKHLVTSYVMGTTLHAESLSTYIDLWKKIKDGQEAYLQGRLRRLYQYYAAEFIEILTMISEFPIPDDHVRGLSLLMTVLSDVLHVQSLVLQNDVDFSSMEAIIEKMCLSLLLGGRNE